jgi:nicotinic acid mononucleotide adenylyltransferase/predicted RNA-binding protein with PIN domain
MAARTGVFPGTFDPPTIAHVAIADAAIAHAQLDRFDFAISRVALGKEDRGDLRRRVAALEALAAGRPELRVVVTDAQLIVDIAQGYDVVVMGADKWAQVNDAAWYESEAERDDAVARLPRVLVVPRSGYAIAGAEVLPIDDDHADVSSTRAREGAHHLIAPAARRRVIVDAMNVIGSTPDGWWKDRDGALRRLVGSLQERSRRTGERIAVVADGRPPPDLPEGVHGGVLVAYATRAGRNAADDRIVDEVRKDARPTSLTVVTSDRGLAERVQALGASVEPASTLSAEASERR